MGFFDKILQGLGFEGENDITPITNNEKINDNNKQLDAIDIEANVKQVKIKRKTVKVTPKNQLEVENILEEFKNNYNVIINLENFNDSDVLRAMDFIAGYCKCLGASVKKMDEYVFFLELLCD